MALVLQQLTIETDNKTIIEHLNLTINPGEVHAIMGPNGSGKSTLANTLAGHPKYIVTSGKILLNGEDLTSLSPDKRAKAGLFLSMQYPPELAGVTVGHFLRMAVQAISGQPQNPLDFHKKITETMNSLSIDPAFIKRSLGIGFSGGEKKRLEVLQLALLNPTYAVLDETDSGLDVDALRIVAEGINKFRTAEKGLLLITHYNRILEYIVPDFVHVMIKGKIVKSGGKELAKEIEVGGYEGFKV
jgi:Fe-S cluster assembly ATP-binding protein